MARAVGVSHRKQYTVPLPPPRAVKNERTRVKQGSQIAEDPGEQGGIARPRAFGRLRSRNPPQRHHETIICTSSVQVLRVRDDYYVSQFVDFADELFLNFVDLAVSFCESLLAVQEVCPIGLQVPTHLIGAARFRVRVCGVLSEVRDSVA